MEVNEAVVAEMSRIKRRRQPMRRPIEEEVEEPVDLPDLPLSMDEGDGAELIDLEGDEPEPPQIVYAAPPGPVLDHPGAAAFRETIASFLPSVTWLQSQFLHLRQGEMAPDGMGLMPETWEHLRIAQRRAAELYNELGISLALARPR